MAASKQSVGVIGLGIIGSRVATRLRQAGHEVWVWNRSPKVEPNFLGSAAEVAETVDILQIFVSDGPALIETINEIAPALAARHVLLSHSTVGPSEVMEAAAIAAKSSAGFLDAPFTGSRDAAERGEIVYYVGGAPELLGRVRPVLEVSSKAILEVGEVGQASLIKLATNLVTASIIEGMAEALALLDGKQVPLSKFIEAMTLNPSRSGTSDMKLPSMVSGEFEPRFALKHMLKDMQLALGVSRETGLDLPLCSAVAGALAAGMHKGWGDLDFSALAIHYGYPGKERVPQTGDPGVETDGTDGKSKPRGGVFSLFGGGRKRE
jgi:3-hydroxyisobutyrate dehydrogenase-like beta-hydroxyacid dehydrogenase